jgi:hypothetical protein
MLEQRKSTQDRPIVLCSDVGMRIQELKTQGSWPKSNRKRWQLETSIKGAAKRMVLREEDSRGLVVTGVDRFGREVHVESVQGDWGLRLDGKREPVRDDAKSEESEDLVFPLLTDVESVQGELGLRPDGNREPVRDDAKS